MRRFFFKTLLGVWLCCELPVATAEAFKWRDQDGKMHYSEKAPPGQSAQSVTLPPSSPPNAPVSKAPQKQPTVAPAPKTVAAPTLPREQREALCTQARDQYSRLESTPRAFRVEADGERVRMTEEERQAALAHEQEAITKYCQ